MSQRTFLVIAGLIFLLVAIVHLARLLLKWTVVFNGWTVPMWVSVVALIVAGYLAFEGLKPRS
jgi:uncharacterized membrane protein